MWLSTEKRLRRLTDVYILDRWWLKVKVPVYSVMAMLASMFSRLFTPCHGCCHRGTTSTCRSNLAFVHQVPIAAGWAEAMQDEKLAQGSYSWPVSGLRTKTTMTRYKKWKGELDRDGVHSARLTASCKTKMCQWGWRGNWKHSMNVYSQ